MYWLPYSSHTSHHPAQTPCLPWISYAIQKLMLDSCKMVEKQSEAFHTFLCHFFPVENRILLHIVLLKCQIEFLKFTSCDNQTLFSRVYFNCCCSCSFEPKILKIGQSSHKICSNNILNFQESTPILNALLKAPRIWCSIPFLLECILFYLSIIYCWHAVVGYQVFLSN